MKDKWILWTMGILIAAAGAFLLVKSGSWKLFFGVQLMLWADNIFNDVNSKARS